MNPASGFVESHQVDLPQSVKMILPKEEYSTCKVMFPLLDPGPLEYTMGMGAGESTAKYPKPEGVVQELHGQ